DLLVYHSDTTFSRTRLIISLLTRLRKTLNRTLSTPVPNFRVLHSGPADTVPPTTKDDTGSDRDE
ncbi:MAG: hypothetical protein M9925_08265, partial [Chloroflexi bacterium]|nr:hypothetical protein [Chloroflexota bacterium]